jgi:5'-3' exonuclease
MLLDTASLYFRAFHGMPDTVTAPDGTPVNAVRGLLDQMTFLVKARKPDSLVACWDNGWRPEFRVYLVPTYKAHRLSADGYTEVIPEKLQPQIPIIAEVLAACGIARVGYDGYEADDIIGTLAGRADSPVDVVTGDRDLFQLVDDRRQIRIIYAVGGLRNLTIIDEAAVTAKYDIPGRAYADFAALRGDPSDGLPGVPGVGEKTAAALIRAFGSVDGIREALDKGHGGFPKGARDKLVKARDYLDVSMDVVRVAADVPLPTVTGTLPAQIPTPVMARELGERWGLGASLSRFLDAVS